ncbi:MAG: hypothetical protein ACP5PA_00175 [Elusimicrobiales bacterium]
MKDVVIFSLLGIFFGAINGVISVSLIKKNINASNKRFYTVYIALFFYKLIFLAVSIWLMRAQKVIIILLYCILVVVFQTSGVLLFLRRYGVKRDT